jgi:hypothetical protein
MLRDRYFSHCECSQKIKLKKCHHFKSEVYEDKIFEEEYDQNYEYEYHYEDLVLWEEERCDCSSGYYECECSEAKINKSAIKWL